MSKKAQQVASSTFKDAVEQTPDITHGYKAGLQALGVNAGKIQVADPRQLEGSVDIDSCTKGLYPEDNRWDYVFSYKETTYFVEVHPASTSEVEIVIKKYDWLLGWLKNHASKMDGLPKGHPAFCWIQTGRCTILSGSKESRRIAQRGLKPTPKLVIKE